MEKILLTGGDGFFGTRFRQYYRDRYEIFSTDKGDLDITDAAAVEATVARIQPQYIIHMAAIAVTDFCNKHPELAHKVNVEGAVNVARAAKRHGSKLVFISTEQVFNGNPEKGPYTETHTPLPDTVYGQNKLEAEGLLAEILPELWVLRFTWLFGLPERKGGINPNILWNTLQLALRGEKVAITNNEFRGLTYVYDIITQFEKIFTIPYGLYHIGSHNDASRYDITCHILRQIGLSEARIAQLVEAVQGSYRDVRLDTSKLKALGFTFPDTPLALQNCLEEFRFRLD